MGKSIFYFYQKLEIYLNNSKTKLNEYKIINNLLPSNTLICLSLIKIFIENEDNSCSILELILQNPNFSLVSQIIKSYQNLKKILIGGCYNLPFYQSLLLSKDYNCSNTLNIIIFYYIDLKVVITQDKVFEQLNVLESVHIVYCSSLYNKNFRFEFEFYYNLSLKQQLLELITKYCKNIKFIDFYGFDQLFNLIENIQQKLNHLIIRISDDTLYYSLRLVSGNLEIRKTDFFRRFYLVDFLYTQHFGDWFFGSSIRRSDLRYVTGRQFLGPLWTRGISFLTAGRVTFDTGFLQAT
ncbi:hypothetical protein RhiirC2_782148 [Rhizophagus irregularis]|uniref:Uncharacterized protein n=1 Tax=Rhizophagus irregularis TaxID=588596 RepID=A0A2N1N3V2_9GLOM|nr:hypothetical protein RhiirC2_782148 [Rhizophagus irregularis]